MYVYIEKKENIIMHMHYKKLIAEMVEAVLRYENCPFECEVSVIITDDNGIRKYNNEYRGLDKSTDVLSFPLINYSRLSDSDRTKNNESILHHMFDNNYYQTCDVKWIHCF